VSGVRLVRCLAAGSTRPQKNERGGREAAPRSLGDASYRFFAFLAFLAAFFAFFAIGLIPPFRLGYAEGAAAPPRRFCRLALSPRVPAPSRLAARVGCLARDVVPSGSSLRAEEKVGQCSRETAPLQSGLSYFFFAFLAFLAAFFAFFAIVPPEGVLLVPDGDSGCAGR
jgi:hypothetical protein